MGKLYYLIKLPRAGGSTWANLWVQEKPGRVIICGDDIRLAMHGQRYNPFAEPFVHAVKDTAIAALLRRNHDVLHDGTNTTAQSIHAMLHLDPEAEAIWLHKPTNEDEWKAYIDLCCGRAVDTNQPDLIPIINKMAVQMKHLMKDFDSQIDGWRQRARDFRARRKIV